MPYLVDGTAAAARGRAGVLTGREGRALRQGGAGEFGGSWTGTVDSDRSNWVTRHGVTFDNCASNCFVAVDTPPK